MIKKITKALMLLIIAAVCTACYARFIEPDLLIVKSYSVETQKPVNDCRVVFFTDTHFGKLYNEKHAVKIKDKINALEPDFVIFGGDLLDNYARDKESIDWDYLREQLGGIAAAGGKFAVWGNHDYGGGAVRIYEDFMNSCGFEVLNDESRIFDEYGIRLVGYDNYLMGWTDPSLYKLQSGLYNIIAAHEPVISQFIDSESDNFFFSGHTHGGQVSIPYLTSRILPEGSGQFVKGFYTAQEIGTDTSLQMYTSSGIGVTKYPFRLMNVPEIISIDFYSG